MRKEVSIRGVRAELCELGEGDPLLFLHAGVGPDEPSPSFIQELATRFHVIAPFHPGFGGSELPRGYRTVGDLAFFYLDLMQQLNLSNVYLVGASFGGWIASEIAVRSTERLSRVALIAPLGIKVDQPGCSILDFYSLPHDQWVDLSFADPAPWRIDYSTYDEGRLQRIARGRETTVWFGWEPFMHDPQLRQWLHRIDVPTKVLWGRQDKIVSAGYARAFAESIPGATLEQVDEAGHYCHLEQPQRVLNALTSLAAGRLTMKKAS